MNVWRTSSWNRGCVFDVTALAIMLLFPLPHLHAEQTGTFGVLNPPSGDNYKDTAQDAGYNLTYSAEGWIAFAETQQGDSATGCVAPASTFVGYAETASDQWIGTVNPAAGDAGYGVTAVSIPVEWALYQPKWDGSTDVYDGCYKKYLQDMIEKYVAQNYQIVLTVSTNKGPSWLTNTSMCPSCQFKGQDGVSPPVNAGAGGPSGTVASYYIANVVFDQAVRNLVGPLIDDALSWANSAVASASNGARTQVDLVRIGISEEGESRYPLGFSCNSDDTYDLEWWAFDDAAQSPAITDGIRHRPQQIGDPGNPANNDCLFGWYPGKGAPSNSRPTECTLNPSITAEQATLDWWSWYFNALADAHAFLYHRFRSVDGFQGPIAFVTPGAGTDPQDLFTYLSDFWNGDESTYETDNPNETVNAGSAWFLMYDQIIYSLNNVWDNQNQHIGTMEVDHSSVMADANPATEDDQTMNPISSCSASDVEGSSPVTITPAPSSSSNFQMPNGSYVVNNATDFQDWSSTRKIHVYTNLEKNGTNALPLLGENPGNNPGTGTYSTSTGYVTGMNDVIKLYNSCGLKELLWAFDSQLNAGGGDDAIQLNAGSGGDAIVLPKPTIKPDTLVTPPQCGGQGKQAYSGQDATIKGYCGYIKNGTCPQL